MAEFELNLVYLSDLPTGSEHYSSCCPSAIASDGPRPAAYAGEWVFTSNGGGDRQPEHQDDRGWR
jgi:hypothetical protein